MEASKTWMDTSSANWLSDLLLQEGEDCNSLRQCNNFNLLDDEEFLSHDIVSVLQGENLQQPLSCESYSCYSYHLSNCETLMNSSSHETSLERPTKQRKTNNHSSSFNEHVSPNPTPSSPSSPTSNFLTFENYSKSNSSPAATKDKVVSKPSQQQNVAQTENQKPQGQGTPQALDHIMAERKRREKLSQSLIALAALIPGLKKMDKASVLGDAIKYVKELQERLRLLEEQSKNREVESVVVVVVVGKSQVSSEDYSSSRDERLPHVEARVSEKDVLLRIHCQNQKGLLLKILGEIQNLQLFVVNSNVLPFGDSILDITIVAQMGKGYKMSTNDLVKNIRAATLKLMS